MSWGTRAPRGGGATPSRGGRLRSSSLHHGAGWRVVAALREVRGNVVTLGVRGIVLHELPRSRGDIRIRSSRIGVRVRSRGRLRLGINVSSSGSC